jgi:hypothetical protein
MVPHYQNRWCLLPTRQESHGEYRRLDQRPLLGSDADVQGKPRGTRGAAITAPRLVVSDLSDG